MKLPQAGRIVAIHPEWSTRTRHLLQAIETADPPVKAIILLGRATRTLSATSALWEKNIPGSRAASLPMAYPVSARALLASLVDLPTELKAGAQILVKAPVSLSFRIQVAIAFRVGLGVIASRWWGYVQKVESPEVIFAITGTSDTTMLEFAIQAAGGFTVHAVHGQAIGPNFAGISDLALFRNQHDADAFDRLGCYGRCQAQVASSATPRRGEQGILLLTNLAHPMNPDYSRGSLAGERALLASVGAAAKLSGRKIGPLLWKPHPVVAELSSGIRKELQLSLIHI